VDRGANQHARQVLRKRAGLSGLLKSLFGDRAEEQESDVTAMSDALAVSVADCIEKSATPEELEANLDETLSQFRTAVLEKAGDDDDGDDDMGGGDGDDEDLDEGDVGDATPPGKKGKKTKKFYQGDDAMRRTVLKGLTPEGAEYVARLEKMAEDAQDAATAALKLASESVAKHADAELLAEARELVGSSNMDPKDVVALLKNAGTNTAARETVVKMVKRQVELIEKSALFSDVGDDDLTGGAPSAIAAKTQLDKFAEELRAKTPKLSIQKAFALACEQHPDLYEEIVEPQDA